MSQPLSVVLRRNWRVTGAIAAFVVFTVIHFLFFLPAAGRYRRALDQVGGLEAVFNPSRASPLLPPRLFALITSQSLTPQDASERGGSGALGVVLLEELGRVAGQAGLEIVSSDPGVVAQQPLSVQIRAQLKLRGRYPQIVQFFDDLADSGSLLLVDHFKITPVSETTDELEISVSRLYLKKAATRP